MLCQSRISLMDDIIIDFGTVLQNLFLSFQKYLPKSSEPQSSCSPHWTSCLPFAKSIELSLINSPNYSRGQSFDEALKVYFTTTRLVNKIIFTLMILFWCIWKFTTSNKLVVKGYSFMCNLCYDLYHDST